MFGVTMSGMRRRGEQRGGLVAASVASLVLHGALALLATTAGRPPTAPAARQAAVSFVELGFLAEEAAPLAPAEDSAAVAEPSAPPEPPRVRAPEALRPAPATVVQDVGPVAVEVGPPPVADAPPPTRPLPAFDARATALAALGLAPSPPTPRVARPSGPTAADLEASLDAHLRAAVTRRDDLSQRPPPDLRRRADGSYAFRGPAFEAVIDREGTVHFSDRGGPRYDGIHLSEGGRTAEVRIRFDPTQRAEARHGNDVWAAERAWFLAETEVLRDRLAAEARAREEARARQAVRAALARILTDSSLTPAARRRRIFLLWEDCADDAVGRAARQVIEAFVRDELPEASPDAYAEAELRALNAARVGEPAFDPYRASARR